MRIMAFSLIAALALSGCATAPTVVRDGNLAALRGRSLASLSGQSAPADATLAADIQANVLKSLAVEGADISGSKPPAFVLQVGVGVSAPAVGVSAVPGLPFKDTVWRSVPARLHFWNRRGATHTATAVVLEVSSGKPVAWAAVRAGSADAKVTADRLVKALAGQTP